MTMSHPHEFCISKLIEIDHKKISNSLRSLTFGQLTTSYIQGPKVMVFRDSFMTAVQDYIHNEISESKYQWTGDPIANEKEILEYKLNIIIWEILERNTTSCYNQ